MVYFSTHFFPKSFFNKTDERNAMSKHSNIIMCYYVLQVRNIQSPKFLLPVFK